jgi:hypothetical protein
MKMPLLQKRCNKKKNSISESDYLGSFPDAAHTLQTGARECVRLPPAALAAQAGIRRRMAERLAGILRETGDPRSGGNGDVFERYPYTGNDAHSWKALQEGRFSPQTY